MSDFKQPPSQPVHSAQPPQPQQPQEQPATEQVKRIVSNVIEFFACREREYDSHEEAERITEEVYRLQCEDLLRKK